METTDGAFTGEDKAGQDSCVPKSGGEQLVHTDGGLHIATALRPKVVNMNQRSHFQGPATMITGGAAKCVSTPPTEMFTNSSPRVA